MLVHWGFSIKRCPLREVDLPKMACRIQEEHKLACPRWLWANLSGGRKACWDRGKGISHISVCLNWSQEVGGARSVHRGGPKKKHQKGLWDDEGRLLVKEIIAICPFVRQFCTNFAKKLLLPQIRRIIKYFDCKMNAKKISI